MKLIKSKKENKIEIRKKSAFFPKNYKLINVEDIFSIKRGRVISNDYISKNKGIYPVYSSATENRGEIGKISTYDIEGEKITWTTDGYYAGTIFYRSGKYNCTNICGVLDLKSDGNVKYYSYLLKNIFPKYVTKTDNRKLMSNTVSKIEFIHTNDIKEQNLITKVIEYQETQLENIKQLIKKIEIRNQYYQDQLISGKLCIKENINGDFDLYKNKETKKIDSQINNNGEIDFPASWIQYKISEVLEKTIGGDYGKEINDSNKHLKTEVITLHIFSGKNNEKSKVYRAIEDSKLNNRKINKGDIIIEKSGGTETCSVGRVFYINDEVDRRTSVNFTNILKINKKFNSKYIYYILNNFHKNRITAKYEQKTTGIANLKLKEFFDISYCIPNLEQQNIIVNVIENLEQELDKLNILLEKEQLRFQWLLDNLLSGEYQVVDD